MLWYSNINLVWEIFFIYRIFRTIKGTPDYKAQYQKVNASCSFVIHKAHQIVRHSK